MPGPLLYSTNSLIKLLIHERYRHDEHYVWCSASFDSTTVASYTVGAHTAPSSDPADIYRRLKDDCVRTDKHSAKISKSKALLAALAVKWSSSGLITPEQKEDIIYLVESADFSQWRPVIYIIPRQPVAARMVPVPAAECASFGPEYIIPDLKRFEFDVLEVA